MLLRAEATLALVALAGLGTGCRSTSPQPSAELMRVAAVGDRAALAALPAGAARAQIESGCLACHGIAMIEQQHKDSAGWAKTLGQMRAWGAPLAEDQVPAVIAYLVQHYGP